MITITADKDVFQFSDHFDCYQRSLCRRQEITLAAAEYNALNDGSALLYHGSSGSRIGGLEANDATVYYFVRKTGNIL